MHIHTIWARLDGPDTGALLPEVVACSLQQGPKSGSMGPVCGVAAAVLAREDDIDTYFVFFSKKIFCQKYFSVHIFAFFFGQMPSNN